MTLPVMVAGGGIAGLTMALTCLQIGVPVQVFESSREIRPLGVGINLQPNAVRELIDLGLGDQLPTIGIEAKEWALVGRNGNDVWAEPRGRRAGYRWPQYSVHRGELQMLLLSAVRARGGPEVVIEGHRLVGYEQTSDSVAAHFEDRATGEMVTANGALLIGADGLHSAARRQLFPDEGDPVWGGAVLWRGTSLGVPIRSGASFTLVGNLEQRFVHYPIGPVDPATGLQRQNWIAELTFDPSQGWQAASWNQTVDPDVFLPAFADWNFDWLDIPELVGRAEQVWEYPMVDRDPAPTWRDGRVVLIGDAAHVMYPVGSNGASQAIVDARVIGAAMVEHGVSPDALATFEARLHADVSALVLRNRSSGPVAILGEVDSRCGGVFDDIDEVIPRAEIEAFMATYKRAAGFAMDTLNQAPPTIAPAARVRSSLS